MTECIRQCFDGLKENSKKCMDVGCSLQKRYYGGMLSVASANDMDFVKFGGVDATEILLYRFAQTCMKTFPGRK